MCPPVCWTLLTLASLFASQNAKRSNTMSCDLDQASLPSWAQPRRARMMARWLARQLAHVLGPAGPALKKPPSSQALISFVLAAQTPSPLFSSPWSPAGSMLPSLPLSIHFASQITHTSFLNSLHSPRCRPCGLFQGGPAVASEQVSCRSQCCPTPDRRTRCLSLLFAERWHTTSYN